MENDSKLQMLESMTVDLDDTFRFHCDQCGKCCTHRNDIILSPMDVFKLSRELQLTTIDFYEKYCVFNIGDNSRLPIIRLASVGRDQHCVLLKNRKCSVHKVKPAVCGMYPMGRYMTIEKDAYVETSIDAGKVKYLLQPLTCGDESEEHTVREWLSGFDIKLEDEAFIRWQMAVARFSRKISELEKKCDFLTMMEIWVVTRAVLYLHYDTDKDFLPQFLKNVDTLQNLLNDIRALKWVARHER